MSFDPPGVVELAASGARGARADDLPVLYRGAGRGAVYPGRRFCGGGCDSMLQ